MTDSRRAQILAELVRFTEPSEPLIQELRAMGWDWPGEPLITLTREHLLSVMERFLAGTLSAERLEEWAESLEVREDVGFEPGHEDLVDDLLFSLANPSINGEISKDHIEQLRHKLVEG